MEESMLTTIDNPYNPFEDYPSWSAWDTSHGYHTESFLARIVVLSPEQSDLDQHLAIEDAIDEAVRENVSGVYKKVTRVVPDDPAILQGF